MTHGQCWPAKAILDNGSQNSFHPPVTEQFIKKLNLRPYSKITNVSGIGLWNNMARQQIELRIFSNVSPNKQFDVSCIVLPVITGQLPHDMVDIQTWNISNNIQLADPTFMIPSEIDLWIGSDLYYTLLSKAPPWT